MQLGMLFNSARMIRPVFCKTESGHAESFLASQLFIFLSSKLKKLLILIVDKSLVLWLQESSFHLPLFCVS